jgi:hypothetical protein
MHAKDPGALPPAVHGRNPEFSRTEGNQAPGRWMPVDEFNFTGAQAPEKSEDPEADLVGRPGLAENIPRLPRRKPGNDKSTSF